MNIDTHSPLWIALGRTFLHVLWVGAVVGLAASIARRAMRRASPEARHAAALAGLLALATSPFAAFVFVYEPATTAPAVAAPAAGPIARTTAEPLADPGGPSPSRPRPRETPAPVASLAWFESWIAILPGFWIAGTTLLLARTAAGVVGVERLRRSARRHDLGPTAERCRALARSLGIARDVSIAACDRVVAPMLIGIVRPMLILPASALSGWDRDLVEMALLHELAHLRRLDNLTSLFQQGVEALLFFHPTTWWLSAWLRLERESCCDALVVARTGDRVGYARLLAALAESRPPAFSASLNERPITTRIRRILFMEDRPMPLKPTAPEALALAAAGLLAASLLLPARAEPPASKPPASADLRRLAEVVAAQPPGPKPTDGSRFDERAMTLVEIARRQAERGDGPGALKTLEGVSFEPLSAKDLARGESVMNDFNYIEVIARVRRDAGDVAGGRDMHRRLAELVLACEPDPARDAAAARFIDDMVADRRGRVIGLSPDGSPAVVSVAVNGAARDAERGDPAPSMPILLNMYLMEELAELREIEAMRPLVDRLDSFAKEFGSPLTRAFLDAWTARAFRIAGDEEASRRRLATARAAFDAVPAGDEKDAATLEFAPMIAAADRSQALEVIRPLGLSLRPGALRRLLGDLCRIDPTPRNIPGGLGVNIGEPGLSVNDEAEARADLPKFVAAARELEDVRPRARLLAILARLQAQANDLAGAMATAESIPDLRRADYPGPADGFYDAVRPATFARIAAHRSQAGDRAGADAAFSRSAALTLAVTDGVERIVAGIVLADCYQAAGRRDESAAVLADVLPLVSPQPEPRRSRMLAAIAEVQARAVGADAALKTADTIRDEPGLEKARALTTVAARLRDAGDLEAARPIARRALACLAPKASDPKPDPGIQGDRITHGGFLDYDAELKTFWLQIGRMEQRGPLLAIVGETAPIAPQGFARPEEERLAKIFATYRSEGLDGALKAAESLESPRDRSIVLRRLASAIPDETLQK